MRNRNEYIHGAHNVICDRSGFKVKSTEVRKEWNHSVVRKEDFEHRHPQDYVRGVRDIQSVPDPRPGAPDSNTHNETTLDAAEAAGQTVISVAATTNMQAGDSILIELDDSTFHLSTISSFVAGDTVTIADALPSKAASGNKVVIASAQTSENDL
jgi:hypothetical protein